VRRLAPPLAAAALISGRKYLTLSRYDRYTTLLEE
jgi:hypothetical protein